MGPLCPKCHAALVGDLERLTATLHAQQITIEEVSEELAEARMQLRQLLGAGAAPPAPVHLRATCNVEGLTLQVVCPGCIQPAAVIQSEGRDVFAPHGKPDGKAGELCGGSMMPTATLVIYPDPSGVEPPYQDPFPAASGG